MNPSQDQGASLMAWSSLLSSHDRAEPLLGLRQLWRSVERLPERKLLVGSQGDDLLTGRQRDLGWRRPGRACLELDPVKVIVEREAGSAGETEP